MAYEESLEVDRAKVCVDQHVKHSVYLVFGLFRKLLD